MPRSNNKRMLMFSLLKPGFKCRVHTWINTDTLKPLYGIQMRVAERTWVHAATPDGKPMLFDTAKEALNNFPAEGG